MKRLAWDQRTPKDGGGQKEGRQRSRAGTRRDKIERKPSMDHASGYNCCSLISEGGTEGETEKVGKTAKKEKDSGKTLPRENDGGGQIQ